MLAMNGNSKLPAPLLAMYGMSGRNMRHFLNNLCSNEETNYLEIGVHTGSTFCSALYGNRVRAVAIDNFSEFNTVNVGDENYPTDKAFHDNLNMVIGENRVNFYNVDCFSLDVGLLLGENGDSRFNVYF